MPDSSLTQQPSALASEMRAYTGLFTEKTFDWDAFPASRGFPDLLRAQLRYVGAGGSPKSNDPTTLKAEHFTFSLVNQPVGKFAGSHAHEVVEHFFILQGVLTVGTVWGDEVVEVKLGPGDLLLNKSGRPHGFRNDGVEPVLMQITVGSGTPEMPVHVCHPKDKDLELARRFGAPGPEKIHLFSPESTDRRHQELAKHVVRYRDRTPVWDKAGFARLTYVGEGGAPAHGYRMDMIHLPKGVAVKPYVRDVEDVYFVLDGRDHRRLGAGRRGRRASPRRARPAVQSGRASALFPQRRCERREVQHGGGLGRAGIGHLRGGMTRSPGASRRIEAGGSVFTYGEAGAGTPLVLLHGIGSAARAFDDQLAGLSDRLHVIAWDAPGYGGSTALAPGIAQGNRLRDGARGDARCARHPGLPPGRPFARHLDRGVLRGRPSRAHPVAHPGQRCGRPGAPAGRRAGEGVGAAPG